MHSHQLAIDADGRAARGKTKHGLLPLGTAVANHARDNAGDIAGQIVARIKDIRWQIRSGGAAGLDWHGGNRRRGGQRKAPIGGSMFGQIAVCHTARRPANWPTKCLRSALPHSVKLWGKLTRLDCGSSTGDSPCTWEMERLRPNVSCSQQAPPRRDWPPAPRACEKRA